LELSAVSYFTRYRWYLSYDGSNYYYTGTTGLAPASEHFSELP